MGNNEHAAWVRGLTATLRAANARNAPGTGALMRDLARLAAGRGDTATGGTVMTWLQRHGIDRDAPDGPWPPDTPAAVRVAAYLRLADDTAWLLALYALWRRAGGAAADRPSADSIGRALGRLDGGDSLLRGIQTAPNRDRLAYALRCASVRLGSKAVPLDWGDLAAGMDRLLHSDRRTADRVRADWARDLARASYRNTDNGDDDESSRKE